MGKYMWPTDKTIELLDAVQRWDVQMKHGNSKGSRGKWQWVALQLFVPDGEFDIQKLSKRCEGKVAKLKSNYETHYLKLRASEENPIRPLNTAPPSRIDSALWSKMNEVFEALRLSAKPQPILSRRARKSFPAEMGEITELKYPPDEGELRAPSSPSSVGSNHSYIETEILRSAPAVSSSSSYYELSSTEDCICGSKQDMSQSNISVDSEIHQSGYYSSPEMTLPRTTESESSHVDSDSSFWDSRSKASESGANALIYLAKSPSPSLRSKQTDHPEIRRTCLYEDLRSLSLLKGSSAAEAAALQVHVFDELENVPGYSFTSPKTCSACCNFTDLEVCHACSSPHDLTLGTGPTDQWISVREGDDSEEELLREVSTAINEVGLKCNLREVPLAVFVGPSEAEGPLLEEKTLILDAQALGLGPCGDQSSPAGVQQPLSYQGYTSSPLTGEQYHKQSISDGLPHLEPGAFGAPCLGDTEEEHHGEASQQHHSQLKKSGTPCVSCSSSLSIGEHEHDCQFDKESVNLHPLGSESSGLLCMGHSNRKEHHYAFESKNVQKVLLSGSGLFCVGHLDNENEQPHSTSVHDIHGRCLASRTASPKITSAASNSMYASSSGDDEDASEGQAIRSSSYLTPSQSESVRTSTLTRGSGNSDKVNLTLYIKLQSLNIGDGH